MSNNSGINKQNVAYKYNGILFTIKRGKLVICAPARWNLEKTLC